MSNYITIPLTEVMLKAGDRVRLVEPEVLIKRSDDSDIEYEIIDGELKITEQFFSAISFNSIDVNEKMLNELSKWDTQEIESIDNDGDIKFVDIPYTWPKEVILEPVDETGHFAKYIDSSKVDYLRINKDEIDYDVFLNYCSMPHAVVSKDKESVYFYTISKSNVNPLKHLEPEV